MDLWISSLLLLWVAPISLLLWVAPLLLRVATLLRVSCRDKVQTERLIATSFAQKPTGLFQSFEHTNLMCSCLLAFCTTTVILFAW